MKTTFKYSAFIRKNTPELRKKLEELGYINKTVPRMNTGMLMTIRSFGSVHDCTNTDIQNAIYHIDCGKNEEAFMAIAAIRNDTDKGSWFTNKENTRWIKMDGISIDGIEVKKYRDFLGPDYHKATPEEIINHFNSK